MISARRASVPTKNLVQDNARNVKAHAPPDEQRCAAICYGYGRVGSRCMNKSKNGIYCPKHAAGQ